MQANDIAVGKRVVDQTRKKTMKVVVFYRRHESPTYATSLMSLSVPDYSQSQQGLLTVSIFYVASVLRLL